MHGAAETADKAGDIDMAKEVDAAGIGNLAGAADEADQWHDRGGWC